MKIFAPPYYQDFQCMAGNCKHTCCAGWEVEVDSASASRLSSLDGSLGQACRSHLVFDEGGNASFRLVEDDRCPFLLENGLCRLILEQGEQILPDICALHPRYRTDLSHRIELGLGLCCEEAARLALSFEPCPIPTEIPHADRIDCDDMTESDEDAQITNLRDSVLVHLYREDLSLKEALLSLCAAFDATVPSMSLGHSEKLLRPLFRLSCDWDTKLDLIRGDDRPLDRLDLSPNEAVLRRFCAYLVNRYLPTAILDCRQDACLSFIFFLCHLLSAVCQNDLIDTARIISGEMEYDEGNREFLFSLFAKE